MTDHKNDHWWVASSMGMQYIYVCNVCILTYLIPGEWLLVLLKVPAMHQSHHDKWSQQARSTLCNVLVCCSIFIMYRIQVFISLEWVGHCFYLALSSLFHDTTILDWCFLLFNLGHATPWAEYFHKTFHIIQEEKLNEEIERMLQKISEFVEVVEMVSIKSSIFSHDGCCK